MGTKASGSKRKSAENSGEQRGRPFPKGTSGNPGGRPKDIGKFRELCRDQTPKAMRALLGALRDPKSRVLAAKSLLEFGWGKAPQAVHLMGKDDGPVMVAGFDLKELSDEQLDQLAALLGRAASPEPPSSEPH